MNGSISTRRSELTFKQEQWQKLQDSLEQKIRELEDSLEKGKREHTLISKTSGSNISAEMYPNYSIYCIIV